VDVEIEPFSSTPVEKWKAFKVTLPESTMAALQRKPKRKSNLFIVGKTVAKIIIHLVKVTEFLQSLIIDWLQMELVSESM